LEVKVTGAHRSDQQGAKQMLEPVKEAFPKMKLVWGDSHYAGTFIDWVAVHLGWLMLPIRALIVPKDAKRTREGEPMDGTKRSTKGFRLLPRRWVVERSFSWIIRWRRLCRDHEGLPQCSEAFIKLSASYRMLTKLAPSVPSY
jgi:transposase